MPRWITTALSIGLVGLVPVSPAVAAGPVPTCLGVAATIVGTDHHDQLRGTAARDVIVGLGGDDRISGLGGDDLLCGGFGADLLDGGPGADALSGSGGADILRGGDGDDRLAGGRDEAFHGTVGRGDDLDGGLGSDALDPGRDGRPNVLHVVPDILRYSHETTAITADLSSATGTVVTASGTETVRVNEGVWILGGHAADTITGNGGRDSLLGGGGRDFLSENSFAPVGSMSGGSGDDQLSAWYSGADGRAVDGGPGRDSLGIGDVQPTVRASMIVDAGMSQVRSSDPAHMVESMTGFERYQVGSETMSVFLGTPLADVVSAAGSDGRLRALTYAGDDHVRGSSQGDYIDAGDGTDTVLADGGRDTCLNTETRTGCEIIR